MKKLFMVLCVVIMFFGIVGCPDNADQPSYSQTVITNHSPSGSDNNSQFGSNNNSQPDSGTNSTPINDGVNNGTSPVPEPATLILLGSGLVGLAGYGRKRFKK